MIQWYIYPYTCTIVINWISQVDICIYIFFLRPFLTQVFVSLFNCMSCRAMLWFWSLGTGREEGVGSVGGVWGCWDGGRETGDGGWGRRAASLWQTNGGPGHTSAFVLALLQRHSVDPIPVKIVQKTGAGSGWGVGGITSPDNHMFTAVINR